MMTTTKLSMTTTTTMTTSLYSQPTMMVTLATTTTTINYDDDDNDEAQTPSFVDTLTMSGLISTEEKNLAKRMQKTASSAVVHNVNVYLIPPMTYYAPDVKSFTSIAPSAIPV
jgi:hypothetical protein